MIEQYKFEDHDRKVIAAVQTLLWKVVTGKLLPPAKLISVAKVLHALWHLPRPTKGISVTINIGLRVQQHERVSGGSSFTFSVEPDLLNLECGESSYESGFGSEAWTTMSWSASPGERTDNDGSWNEGWLGEPYFDQSTINDLADYTISIDDDDNALLCDDDSDEEDISDEEA